MSYIIAFFRLIGNGLYRAFNFLISVHGQIATLFTTIGTSLYSAFSFLGRHSSTITVAADRVQTFSASVTGSSFVQSEAFQAFAYTLALDDLWTYLTSVFSFFVGGCVFLLTVVLPFLFTFGFSVMVVNSTRNMVNSFLPNAAKF